jgi:ATP-dependent helicase/nuclease subunit A
VTRLHGQVGRASVADLLKALLDETHYRAALIAAGQTRAARNASKLLADAHRSGIVGVGEFLEYVKGLRDSGTREGEARSTAEGAVQIMSVHAAKGLEFPVVVIGDVTHGRRGSSPTLLDPELGLLLPLKDEESNLPAAYRLGKMRSDDQEAAESDRLLYVAATRAREKLIVNGCIRLKQDGRLSALGGWLGKMGAAEGLGLAEATVTYHDEGARAVRLDLQVGETAVPCTIYEPRHLWDRPLSLTGAEAEAAAELPPAMLEPVQPLSVETDELTAERDRDPPRRVWRVVPAAQRPTAPARVVGLLVHEALKTWSFPDEVGADGAGTFGRWVEARAREHGVTDGRQLRDAVRQTRALLNRFREHELHQEMANADRRLHEVPYSTTIDGRPENGTIDAMYLQDGEWTIVEFKTDDTERWARFRGTPRCEEYQRQARRYAAAAERLSGERPRVILCMLNCAGKVYLHPV